MLAGLAAATRRSLMSSYQGRAHGRGQRRARRRNRGRRGGRFSRQMSSRGGVAAGFRGPALASSAYIESELRPNEAQGYRAAGFLVCRRNQGQLEVLLCEEKRKKNEAPLWNIPGGKREPNRKSAPIPVVRTGDAKASRNPQYHVDKDALETASRELAEESAGALRPADVEAVAGLPRRVLWFPSGKYALFVAGLPDTDRKIIGGAVNDPAGKVQRVKWLGLRTLGKTVKKKADGVESTGNPPTEVVTELLCGGSGTPQAILCRFGLALMTDPILWRLLRLLDSGASDEQWRLFLAGKALSVPGEPEMGDKKKR